MNIFTGEDMNIFNTMDSLRTILTNMLHRQGQ